MEKYIFLEKLKAAFLSLLSYRSEDQELSDKMQMPVKTISINSESFTSATEEQEIDVFVKLTKTDFLSTQEYIKRLVWSKIRQNNGTIDWTIIISNKIMTQGNSVLPYTLLVLVTSIIIQRINNSLPG